MIRRLNPPMPLWLPLAVFCVVLLFVGTMDYQDAERERAHYCDMMRSGAWPDYREIFEEECNET